MAIKDPDLEYPIHPLVSHRWSPCVFAEKPVEPEKLHALFESARWAASSYNEQPWHWVIGMKGSEAYDRILSLLVESNQAWAKNAPVLGISVARLFFEKNGKPNRHAFHDVGLSMGLLCIQASVEDLYVHQMAGFDYKAAVEALNLPEGHEAVAAFAIGYVGDPSSAPEALKERDTTKRQRKRRLIYEGTWGEEWNG